MQKKKSLNPIPLSLRDRKRYIVFQLFSEGKEKFNGFEVKRAIESVLLQLFGEVGLAKMNYLFIDFNEKKSKGIIRSNNTHLEEMKSGILFLKEIGEKTALPKIVFVSGSLKKAKTK